MKKLATLLVLSSAATPALAADLIMPPPPPPPVVVVAPPLWSGLYLGGQLGGVFHSDGALGGDGAFIRIPAVAATPGTPAVPPTPFIPGTPATPGTPGQPAIPPTDPIVVAPGTLEFSFACAGAGPAAACSGAIINNGVETPTTITRAELSAAIAAAGGDPAAAEAAAVAVQVGTPGGIIPGTPGQPEIPAVPGTPGTPDQPATPGSPAVPGTPGSAEQIINVADLPGVTRVDDEDGGFVGGVHVGYDFQSGYSVGTGALVFGVVADLSYVDVERFTGFTAAGEVLSVREELDYLATVRARLGIGYERALLYATGGLAFGKVDTTFVNTLFDDVSSDGDTRVGYAVGAGVDFLVSQNFSLGVEYLYTDLGDGDASRSYDLGGGTTLELSPDEDFDFHTVWAKASFRFN